MGLASAWLSFGSSVTCFFSTEKHARHRDVARKHKRTRTFSSEEHARPDEEAGTSAKDGPEVSPVVSFHNSQL